MFKRNVMKCFNATIKFIIWAFFLLNIQACGTKPLPMLNINFIASSQINPDINNRPSPLVVTIYQLKVLASIQNADFFSLYDNPTKTLGSDLVFQDQIEIKPSQTLNINQTQLLETKYIGLVAAFRDITNSDYQIFIPIKNIKKNTLTIVLDPASIQIRP